MRHIFPQLKPGTIRHISALKAGILDKFLQLGQVFVSDAGRLGGAQEEAAFDQP